MFSKLKFVPLGSCYTVYHIKTSVKDNLNSNFKYFSFTWIAIQNSKGMILLSKKQWAAERQTSLEHFHGYFMIKILISLKQVQ